MGKIFTWIKTHKLTSILFLIVFSLLYIKFYPNLPTTPITDTIPSYSSGASPFGVQIGKTANVAPAPEITNRMVITESYLSLLVNNVTLVQKQILQKTVQLGGYMINSNINNPQDVPTATITIRIPKDKLSLALESFKSLSVKVVSENLSGEDITDQYVDNKSRLDTLDQTKAKLEEILTKAVDVSDILNIQREIINVQSQIDAIKGQQNYLQKSAETAKLTVYLSTDELALPYAPETTWRPQVIFKQAVRSLIGNIRKIGTVLVWLLVYSIVWIPIVLLILFIRKIKSSQNV